jgi:transposase
MSRLELRCRAIGMLEAGSTQVKVAESLGVSLASVKRWWKRNSVGESLEDRSRSGRPSAISRVAKIVIAKSVGKRRQSTRKLASRLTQKGYPVSRESVRRYLKKDLGLKSISRPRKPFLTPRMREARLKFAHAHLKWTIDDWQNVLWSDECFFHLFPRSNSSTDRVWIQNGQNIEASRTVKHSAKVMVWGMFSYHGLSKLHFVPTGQTVNAQYYRENILAKEGLEAIQRKVRTGPLSERKLFQNMSRAIFMQDSAPPHVTKETYRWLDLNFPCYWKKGEWPGNSPDLNPIENLWSIIKQELSLLSPASSLETLKMQLRNSWSNINPDYLQNLVKSMPERMKKVVENRGDFIGY